MIVPAKQSRSRVMAVLLTSGGWIVAAALTTLVVSKSNAANAVRNANLWSKRGEWKRPAPLLLFVVVSHIQRIGCQPEKTTLHGGQSRSWSAEQGKENKIMNAEDGCVNAISLAANIVPVRKPVGVCVKMIGL